MLSAYHTKYFAYELTRRCPVGSVEKLAGALVDAQVDLNPHQVDAALFAFNSPLSRGALLADEVGLGKTIEAGLVLSQKWAERKRRILVITPSNLRKQWFQELADKFFLPCRILEAKLYNAAIRQGQFRPFEVPEIVICSYQFARNKAGDVQAVPWDLVVIDEAHRLRNVYKPSNVIANTLKLALAGKHKLLLTATPLQNSLLELFALVSFIDEHAFGDLKSFREQFANRNQEQMFQTLKARLKPVCHRTLRRQVTAYIPYTERLPLLEEFTPEDSEDQLYHLVSEYLQRDNLEALPASQRSLMTLVLRKLLASSTFAIAGALTAISNRLKTKLRKQEPAESLEDELDQDYEALDETAEEWTDDEPVELLTAADRRAVEREIADLDTFARLASSIEHNAKGKALLKALNIAFAKAQEIGAEAKAIIFTESRRTQSYLLRVLADSPFRDGIVLFNGSNTDDGSRLIYSRWLERHHGSDRVTGSRSADMRSALVDYFREQGRIMIATEAGAEGINLQFCSLVVNYDLPWNPQRIEQRIGRCHRYGQKHDVVVVNFLNRKNAADQRVFELLSEKFQLFEGVFGASDEVLGAIESGVDFEKRIAAIYQNCRKPEEIATAFNQLQLELSLEINESMTRTRQQLLEDFDDEVREKLKVRDEASRTYLNRYERLLMQLTRHELEGQAEFLGDASFRLAASPVPQHGAAIPLGLYELPRRSGEAHLYRLNHPLAEALIANARSRDLPTAEIHFDYGQHDGKVSSLEPLVGKTGWLELSSFSVEALDQAEDHLIFSAVTDDGQTLDEEVAQRLLTLPCASAPRSLAVENKVQGALDTVTQHRQATIQTVIAERNASFFVAEADKLDAWADDLKVGLEREIREIDRQIKDARRAATTALTLEEKLAGQKQIKALEAQRNQKRRSLFDAQDQVDKQREDLIAVIEGKLNQTATLQQLFMLRWILN
ncbi:SNF2-related protein [Accumulibacter sp.]|uniref:SNF2-related protein n=1 Tax=Accumulibacter sp. TaxID=2053492 RepID=UPI0025F07610|nr:SNF2-related protein [Accumulibacter sp.]MCM8611876.1 DEAD/DEAH box helicase [Accumulibacter sp.]MCM8635498.1 DEAD/DEAH box helicase [Accumulibacter sp.]MCM8639076.1 DEAD/DEAH box helicase [Accumulibacter sp.]